ncbi:unnamed protein product [Trichobilharzia szidati]|nr:unnamed protein product [Trichobilharzia szidati]
MQKLFSFENLFSEIPTYQPFRWRFSIEDPVPASVSRHFHPVDLCKELVKIQLRKGESPMDGHTFSGMDRPKYFTYYTSSVYPYPTADLQNWSTTLESVTGNQNITQTNLISQPPTYVSRYVQTMYRDSEAQTDPYSPPYVVSVGETPETLTLATLGYGHGLPAGLYDVETIERARQRREVESNLEPYKDIANDPVKVAKRRKILEKLENREWYYREREVEALQEVRLNVLTELLRRREERQQEIMAKRLDRTWQERCAKKEAKCRAIQYRYIAELRKLLKRRIASKEFKFKRDVISDYATPSSQVFAPLTRLGVFPDRSSESYVVKNAYLTSYEGLLALEASLPRFVFEPRIKIKKPVIYTKDGFLRREYRHQEELAELHNYLLKTSLNEENNIVRKPRFLQKIEKPIPRPLTPGISPPTSEESEEHELAATVLQSLIRGRAIQTQMYEGKEKRRELISELRSTHALLKDEQAQKKRQKLTILSRQEDHDHLIHQDNRMEAILGRFESDSLANMLDFLSKELDRLIEERRAHALILLAERQRRIREAEESGTRQKEERRRREQDEIFKQLVKVHEETVDNYLANIAGLTVDTTASQLAREEISKLAKQIDEDSHLYEMNRDELKSDELAAELVHNFLIPYVNKQSYELHKERRQRKYLNAAHREIWGPLHDAAEVLSTTGVEERKHQNEGTSTLPNNWWSNGHNSKFTNVATKTETQIKQEASPPNDTVNTISVDQDDDTTE